MADVNLETERLADIMRRVNEEMNLFGEVTQHTQDKLTDAQMLASKGWHNYTAASKKGVEAVDTLAKAGMATAKAMYNGQKGATAFNESIDGMGAAVNGIVLAIGLLFPPLRLLTATLSLATVGLTKFAKAAAEQSDALYKGYQDLSKSGAAASDGMTGVFKDAQKLGLGFQELDQYTKLVAESASDLALFGGTVYKGRQQFADMGQEMGKYRRGLMNAGMTQEDINDGAMSYLRLQSRIGQTQNKTVEDLAIGARQYLIEQDALTKLTGMNRKEAEAAREEIRSQERFAAKLEEMRANKQTTEAKALEDTYLILYKNNKLAAQGFADVSTNMLTTEAAQQSYLGTQGESMKAAQMVTANQLTAAQAAQKIAQAHGNTATQLGATLGQMGVYNKTYGDLAGDLRLRAMSEKDIAKQMQEIEKDRIKQGIAGNSAADKATQAQTDLRLAQQETMLALQKLVNVGVGPVTTILKGFANVVESVALGLSQMLKWLGWFDKEEDSPEVKVAKQREEEADRKIRDAQWQQVNATTPEQKKAADENLKAAEIQLTAAQQAKTTAIRGGESNQVVSVTEGGAAMAYRSGRRGAKPGTAPTGGAAPIASSMPVSPGATSGPGANETPVGTGGGGAIKTTQVSSKSGKQAPINSDLAPAFQNLINYLDNAGYAINSLGGYTDRDVRGQAGQKSMHAYGAAIDINPSANPMGSTLITDLPPGIDVIAKQLGLGWGGTWSTKKDAMHFSAAVSEGGSLLQMRDGGIIKAQPGGTMVNAAEAGVNEAFIPLKNGKVPVSLSLGLGDFVDFGKSITDNIQTLLQANSTEQNTNMQTMVSEMKTAFRDGISNLIGTKDMSESGMELLAGIMNDMVREQKSSNDIQTRLLRAQA
jgi:hypothetical protein